MVSLIIVSHSEQLANGVKELAVQMTGTEVQIAAVGGLLQDDGRVVLGTDTLRIVRSIEELWCDDGVLILVDLGSAILSAEQAIELLPDGMAATCRISSAPLVEGAVAAALEASFGHALASVNAAAEAALQLRKYA